MRPACALSSESTFDMSTSSPVFRWPPVLAVALSTFTVVTAEMLPVGILTPIATALDVPTGTAGTSMTITGIVAALVAMFSAVLSGRADRCKLLAGMLLLMAAANTLGALAPNFAVFALARVLIGISMGIVWANAGAIGPRLTDPGRLGRTMTIIFSGVSIGMVLGLPAGTLLATLFSWRLAVGAVAVLALAASIFAFFALPPLPVAERASLAGLFSPWKDAGVRNGLVITILVVIGQFISYTYLRPVLETGPGISDSLIVAGLTVFGIAGIFGNFFIGTVAHASPRKALLIALGAIAAGSALLPFSVSHLPLVFAALVIWGAVYGGIGVSTQAWISQSNPELINQSSAMWSGVFNASIAAGSFTGALLFGPFGGQCTMLIGAGVVVIAWLYTLAKRPQRS